MSLSSLLPICNKDTDNIDGLNYLHLKPSMLAIIDGFTALVLGVITISYRARQDNKQYFYSLLGSITQFPYNLYFKFWTFIIEFA